MLAKIAKKYLLGEDLWFDISELKKRKTSDTLFILGSGESILGIRDWDEIRNNDSFGFNFGMLHWFAPTYYSLELPRNKDSIIIMKKILDYKKCELRNTYFLVKDRVGYQQLSNCLFECGLDYQVFTSLNFKAATEKSLIAKLSVYKYSMLYKLILFSQGVASVEQLVIVGWLMGYKKIVLCGIDLNNTKYFYENGCYNHLASRGLVPSSGQTGGVHKTNSAQYCYGGMPVSEVLKVYQKHLLKDRCSIYIESKSSALSSIFPVYGLS